MSKFAVILPTLESHRHLPLEIRRGIDLYKSGAVVAITPGDNERTFLVEVRQKNGEIRRVTVTFTRDGRDFERIHCFCTRRYKEPPVCSHVTAAILGIQGGIVSTALRLGKRGTAKLRKVEKDDTAYAIGSGILNVYATPAMIALMENAACNCIADCAEPGETSVGTKVEIVHLKPTPIGASVTAYAEVREVFGRRIEFDVTAYMNKTELIGEGRHTRMFVHENTFMAQECLKPRE